MTPQGQRWTSLCYREGKKTLFCTAFVLLGFFWRGVCRQICPDTEICLSLPLAVLMSCRRPMEAKVTRGHRKG